MGLNALARAYELSPDDANISRLLAQAHLAQNDPASALLLVQPLLIAEPFRADLHALMAEIREALGQSAGARDHQMEAMRLRGGVLSVPATGAPQARILFLCSINGADLPLDFLFDNARFDMTFIYPGLGEPEAELPACDLVFNAVADPDVGSADFAAVTEFLGNRSDLAALALLNPPSKLPRTRRDQLAEMVTGINGLLVPRTIRLSCDELSGMANDPEILVHPKLVRTAGTHGGDALERVSNSAQLADFLKQHPADNYYLTDYVDFRSDDGWFRKYRFIFINRKPYPFHLAIMDQWKIHYWRAGMSVDAWKCAEEERFMRDAASTFSHAALNAVSEIGRAMDLDYGGLDCGLMPDGRVIVFEANAAMLVHLNDDPVAYPYKHELVPLIRDQMSAYLLSQVSDRR